MYYSYAALYSIYYRYGRKGYTLFQTRYICPYKLPCSRAPASCGWRFEI